MQLLIRRVRIYVYKITQLKLYSFVVRQSCKPSLYLARMHYLYIFPQCLGIAMPHWGKFYKVAHCNQVFESKIFLVLDWRIYNIIEPDLPCYLAHI